LAEAQWPPEADAGLGPRAVEVIMAESRPDADRLRLILYRKIGK
jgi:hypothetical protein